MVKFYLLFRYDNHSLFCFVATIEKQFPWPGNPCRGYLAEQENGVGFPALPAL